MAKKEFKFDRKNPVLKEFVLKNGQYFKSIAPLPPDIKLGRMKECFGNALFLAALGKYYYCEGYASFDGINTSGMHAWVVNKKYEVIDPTWDGYGHDYYGIIFKYSYVISQMSKDGKISFISLIDNWEDDYPLLRASPAEFRRNIIIPKYSKGVIKCKGICK